MDVRSSPSSPSLQPNGSPACVSTLPPNDDSNPTVENHSSNRKHLVNRKKKKTIDKDEPSSSSCSSSIQRGTRVSSRRRFPRVRFGPARRVEVGDVESIALPLGMSFAAVVAQVLEKKDVANERLSPDYLSVICTSAVRESLANVFGDKFDCFVRNFEKSFGSTLRTLRLINDSSKHKEKYLAHRNTVESSTSDEISSRTRCYRSPVDVKDSHSEVDLPCTTQNELNIHEAVQDSIQNDSMNRELVISQQVNQLACITPSTGSVVNQSVLSTIEKSVVEQVRSNDLKTVELGLTMRKLKLKETQLALNLESNHLERSKLAMGISRASFKAEKFKNQLEDTRHAELLKKCIDCLVAGLLIMSFFLTYGAYVYSYKRISDATSSCNPLEESKSWWIPKPMASFNSGLHTLKCQVQVVSRMMFGVLLILAVAYLLMQRSATSKQTMPVTFILLLLGVACGLAGKFCVDTLGGSGYYWLFYWEILCLVHFLSNVFTSVVFFILHGPVNVSPGMRHSTLLPYWIRRSLFYSVMLLVLPSLCGLMPFASLSEWKDHVLGLVLGANDES
ncbi:putative Protein CPR-5 [Corchorus capsularis]|uniref:CPR5 protein n=1 Tax=Corchorus capsularis TaxID=210143 RepID=A0A1R3GD17_COCAP|nr:putative Protein CPR-5 [Corchorus capsularis]